MRNKLFIPIIFNLKNLMDLRNLKNLMYLIIFNLINLQSSQAQMFWNQAASFTGAGSSYIAVRNSSTLNPASYTLEAWINPANLLTEGIIVTKGFPFSTYNLSLNFSGRLVVYANGNTAIKSKSTSLIPVNQWTHVAVTCQYITAGRYTVYINGVLDTSAIHQAPNANSDSLYIGKYFNGQIDEIRFWNRELSSSEIYNNFKISLAASTGLYSGLKMSMTFQNINLGSNFFTTFDLSHNDNSGYVRGATSLVDLTGLPSKSISLSNCVFTGIGGYLSGADHTAVSPTNAVTLQAWINPQNTPSDCAIIHKGTPTGSTTNYSLNIIGRKLAAKINGITFTSLDTIPIGQWSHVAFTYVYTGFSRTYFFYINGKIERFVTEIGGANIVNGTDSLYIGGPVSSNDFYGFIDEVRISEYAKTFSEINDSMFLSMQGFSNSTVAYNLDGYTYCNSVVGPLMYTRGNCIFDGLRSAPINNGLNLNFQKGFILKSTSRRIPEPGLGGVMIDDTLNVLMDENITDVNVFVALDHYNIDQLYVDIIPPWGSRIYLSDLNSTKYLQHNINTIFNDQAPSGLVNNTYTAFTPTIKSTANILSQMNGFSTKGLWRIKIFDNSGGFFPGRLYAWGLQFNNKTVHPKVVSCNVLLQGFYNASTNLMNADTVRGYLRGTSPPYAVVDSSKAILKSSGTTTFSFANDNAPNMTNRFLHIKHRNSIETWSQPAIQFAELSSQIIYDFTTSASQSYGNNQKQIDASPVKFAIYGGDVNQDGVVDATDAGMVDNAAFNFTTGYVKSDVTGDNVVDASDAALTGNNAFNFVTKIIP